MNIAKILIKLSDRYKTLLMKVLPITYLRKLKRKLIERSYKKLSGLSILAFERNKYIDGINLIGNIRAEIGLGQSCRLVANELEHSNIDFGIMNYTQVSALRMNDHSFDHKICNQQDYNINLIHINPYELGLAYLQIDKSVWDYRYNIAFWLWELEVFPQEWTECIPYLDEIWTPSEFASNSIRKITSKPVKTIPYCVTAPIDERFQRDYFSLPEDKFLFLTMYDSNSTMERKNPIGAIEAYKLAFPKERSEVGIVIKINNAQQNDIGSLNELLSNYKNVYYITDVLEKIQVNSLIKCVDVFVSLHRAEGFGLVLAEAMLLETPTIATNWSSNTEFMTKETSCLVDYNIVEIMRETGPYKPGYCWAEPKIAEAAEYMFQLFSNKEYYEMIAQKAKLHIENQLSMKNVVELIENRIKEIYTEYDNKKDGIPSDKIN